MASVTVSAADVSLYHVAAAQLGDATQWWRIAQANDMTDPDLAWLSAPVTLQIPMANATLTSGIPDTTS
jgi:hypothetical protein